MKNLDTIIKKTMDKYPFFISILNKVEFVEDYNCSTTKRDDKIIRYNPAYLNRFNKDEQEFIIVHELMHIVYEHDKRQKDKDEYLWNVATDAVINYKLLEEGYEIPINYVYYADALNKTAEEYYEMLLNISKESEQLEEVYDESLLEKLKDKIKSFFSKKDDSKEIESINNKEESNKYSVLNEQKREIIKTKQKAIINWRYYLHAIKESGYDWSFKNAEIENNVISPKLEATYKSETEILIDVSGSIDEVLVKNFINECKYILGESVLRIGFFDDKFYGFTSVSSEKDIDDLVIYGYGGTDFNVAVNAFSKHATNKIIFTDGEAPMPDVRSNIYWFVFKDVKINPLGGKVVYVPESDLKTKKEKHKQLIKRR